MTGEDFVIYNSKLEEAHNTSDKTWLNDTFARARKVIENGGRVALRQRFSDASSELVEIIDTLNVLEHYKSKYST